MIKGSIVALVTPFNSENQIDFEALESLLDLHLKAKTDGILLFGTTGESEALSVEEEKAILEFTIRKLENKIPLIVGITSNITEKVIAKAKIFSKYVFDSYLVITPYYNKTNESGMIKHFQLIADRVDKPIIIYNVPRRTGICITIHALEVLAKHPNIVGIKEASGDLEFQTKLLPLLSESFVLYSGEDSLMLPSLALGAKGTISVIANSHPRIVKEILTLFSKDISQARQLFTKYLPLFSCCFVEVSPIPIKFILNQMGFRVGRCRLPYGELSHQSQTEILAVLEQLTL